LANLKLPEINRVLLAGRLTRDPDLRYTPNGTAVCNFSLAVGRRYKDPNSGEWKEDTSFFRTVAWQRQAETCAEYLHKGSAVYVEGSLQSRTWETEDGQRRSVVEVRAHRVQFLDKLGAVREGDEFQEGDSNAGQQSDTSEIPPEDDLPF
jgi:single-strand DNA-binding protein